MKDNLSWSDDFPLLHELVRGKRLVFLDSGASTQKPLAVINAIDHYYRHQNANIHRGVYYLSERATQLYEDSRESVRQFIHAEKNNEIVFTRGTTESINLVAHGFASSILKPGDEVLISGMEHHSNIVPWQMACERSGAVLKVIPVLDDGSLDQAAYNNLLSHKTKLVALIHVSNVLGTVNPIKTMIERAHQVGAAVMIDGAQSVPHMSVDVQSLDCDFYAFSAHKLYGPTGVGVLYGKEKWLEQLPPYQGGGDMIRRVTFEKTEYAELPHKFEAGTPNIAGVIGLKAAIDYLNALGIDNISNHEAALTRYATKQLLTVDGLKIIGTTPDKLGVISFVLDFAHPHDVGTILDSEGVAVRAGHHCAMPLMQRFGVPATVRVSFGLYNTSDDVDVLLRALSRVRELFVS